MSLFAVLYVAGPEDPSAVLASLQQRDFEQTGVSATARRVTPSGFLLEDYGIAPSVSVYFTLDKLESARARRNLAELVRGYMSRTTDDVLLMYLDIPVVRRIGAVREVVRGYESFVPAPEDWVVVDG